MPAFRDLTDKVFDRLTALSCVGKNKQGNMLWLCRCSCDGKMVTVPGGQLVSGNSGSCGCHKQLHGHNQRGKLSPTYISWQAMHARCLGKDHEKLKPYYVGVKVCNRWNPAAAGSFLNFLADKGERPEGTSFGRLGDVGDYEPMNAFWMSNEEQQAAQVIKRLAKTSTKSATPTLLEAA
jgi:hypothetical protein